MSLSPQRLQVFVRDIWAVAIGLRGAHLIDCCHFAEPDLEQLGAVFNDLTELEPLANLVILYEPMTAQTFIANIDLLGERVKEDAYGGNGLMKRYFVRIDGEEPEFTEGCADKTIPLLNELSELLCRTRHRASDALPIARLDFLKGYAHPERKLVSVAGVILGFPVIYVLCEPKEGADPTRNALAHSPLWICKVYLQGEKKHDDHLLLQCSFPAKLFAFDGSEVIDEAGLPKGVQTIRQVTHLAQQLFCDQLDEARSLGWPTIWCDVDVHVEGPVTMDRVAL